MNLWRKATILVTALFAAAGLSAVGGTSASAAPFATSRAVAQPATVYTSCGPKIDPNYAVNVTSVMTKALPNGGYVELRRGYWSYLGQYIYWTRVTGNSTSTLHLDWSDNGGSDYSICKELWYDGSTNAYTYAINDPGGREFKAYAYVGGKWYGSSSWY